MPHHNAAIEAQARLLIPPVAGEGQFGQVRDGVLLPSEMDANSELERFVRDFDESVETQVLRFLKLTIEEAHSIIEPLLGRLAHFATQTGPVATRWCELTTRVALLQPSGEVAQRVLDVVPAFRVFGEWDYSVQHFALSKLPDGIWEQLVPKLTSALAEGDGSTVVRGMQFACTMARRGLAGDIAPFVGWLAEPDAVDFDKTVFLL
jgi:hypothetical protein